MESTPGRRLWSCSPDSMRPAQASRRAGRSPALCLGFVERRLIAGFNAARRMRPSPRLPARRSHSADVRLRVDCSFRIVCARPLACSLHRPGSATIWSSSKRPRVFFDAKMPTEASRRTPRDQSSRFHGLKGINWNSIIKTAPKWSPIDPNFAQAGELRDNGPRASQGSINVGLRSGQVHGSCQQPLRKCMDESTFFW